MAFLWIFLFSMVAYPNFHPSNQTSLPSASDLALRSCIADLCIFPEDLFINQVAIEYGGSKDANELCFRVEAKGLYLRIRASNHPLEQSGIVESIEIARGGNCSKTIEPKKPFRSLTTSAGLAVGDSYKKAIHLYGNPRWIRAKDASKAKALKLDSKVVQIDQSPGEDLLHGHDFVLGYMPDYSSLNALFVYIDQLEVTAVEASVSE